MIRPGTRTISAHRPSLHTLKRLLALLPFVVVLLALPGCRKEEMFSDDTSIRLNFSQEEVLFDTIFTTVGSVTKRFVARNSSSNAVRVNIRLEGGSPSPFRINVDGATGTTFNDVEILGGDSIYVFVEATLGPGGSSTPFIIEDRILFNTNGNEQPVKLVAWGQDAHFFYPDRNTPGLPPYSIIAGLDDNGQTTCETVNWPNDKPYVIYGYAVVDSCSTLSIDPGVRVYVHGGGGLWIYRWGKVQANGTLTEPITFQSDRLEPAYAGLPGQWDRIWVNDGPTGNDNVFTNVIIKNALVGVQCETWPLVPDAPTSAAKVVLNNVRILNCSAAGILSRNFSIESNNLFVGDCGQYSVALTGGGNYFFNHSTIANLWGFSVRQTPAFYLNNLYADINGTVQVRDITASTFQNSIIHGTLPNEFQLEFNELSTPVLSFRNMLLKTDQNTSGAFFDQNTIYRNQSPGFVNSVERDFHLTANAFARNLGITSSAVNDLDGNLRNCDGGGWDLGCYEYCN